MLKNNKGFTLVELLSVIVVLGIVMAILVRSVTVNMKEAKMKTEKVFVSKLEDVIEQYIDLNKRDFIIDGSREPVKIEKLTSSDGKTTREAYIYIMKHKESRDFTFKDIIDDDKSGFIKKNDLVNPANEDEECKIDTVINIYRDTDFVYYFETELSCIIDDKNQINTLPQQESKSISNEGEEGTSEE